MTDYYAILGLQNTATLRDVKAAYRLLAKKYHPDVNKSSEAARHMQAVNEAYETLGDPIKRAEYDQIREMGGGSAQVTPEQHIHVACAKCSKIDSTLRVSTFTTVWSFLFFSTYRGWSQILCARCRVLESLKFNLQVLIFGWWGIPWGVIWTVVFFVKNALGGHQPRENNAVLLATVGKNLIDTGDYIEAEKALIESLKLKDNDYVQNLLKIAKSRASFKKEKGHLKKAVNFESHPLIYNIVVLMLLAIAIFVVISFIFNPNEANPKFPKKEIAAESQVEKDIREATQAGATRSEENRKKEIYDSNTQGMLHQSWIEKWFAKINIFRGDRWALPIKLGDSRDHVYQILGDPADNSDPYIAANQQLQKDVGRKDDTKFWMDKGLIISFKDDSVNSRTVGGYECATKVNTNPIVYGIYSTDNAETLIKKLGLPYLPNATNSNPDFSYSQAEFEWRLGNLKISRSILAKEETDDFKKLCSIGYPWGGITVEDLKPILQEEQNRTEDAKIKKDKVSLSGAQISAKEIYERYKDRVYLVTSYNSKNEPFSFGTGFLYKYSFIVTNYHVVENARSIKVKPLHGKTEEEGAAVIYANKESDWVILDLFHKFSAKDREPYPPVQLAAKPQTGDPVTVIGNPEGLTGSLTTGVVSSIRSEDGIDWIQISAPISHGSSGSPVFDGTGRWIGVATLSFVEGQNLNLATPSKPIVDEIESGKNVKQLQLPLKPELMGRDDYSEYLRKSRSGIADDVGEAIKGFNSLLQEYPDQGDQNMLLGDLADTYPEGNTKELLEIYDKQIALGLDWNYFPLINKGLLLWNIETQKGDSQSPAASTFNDLDYNSLKNAIYNILKKNGASAYIISSIEVKGGPEKVSPSWWKTEVIDKLPIDDSNKLKEYLKSITRSNSNPPNEPSDTALKPDFTECYNYFSRAIEMAKKAIQKDLDQAKKNYVNNKKMNEICKKADHQDWSKQDEEWYQQDLIQVAARHAGDAYEIGYLYWMMDNIKDADLWLEKSKQMAPNKVSNTKACDKILEKIHIQSGTN